MTCEGASAPARPSVSAPCGRVISSISVSPEPGTKPPVIPGYSLGELLGRGGMGVVYSAHHDPTGRDVALKWLPATAHPHMRQRFIREARVAASLRHPHIVTVFDAGPAPDGDFIAMELVPGMPLSAVLESGTLGQRALVDVLIRIARALQFAHDAGIVHRDVKPANILIDNEGEPRLVDFGLVRSIDPDRGPRVTGPGMALGTLAYMAPEVAAGNAYEAGPSVDVFALGAILYEHLAGGLPYFEGAPPSDPKATIVRVIDGEVTPLPPSVPEALATVCLAALSKDPARRPTDRELADGLEAAIAPLPRSEVGRSVTVALIAATLAVVLAGAAAVGVSRWRTQPGPSTPPVSTMPEPPAAPPPVEPQPPEPLPPAALEPILAAEHEDNRAAVRALAAKVLSADRGSSAALAHAALGRVLLLDGDFEGSRRELGEAAAADKALPVRYLFVFLAACVLTHDEEQTRKVCKAIRERDPKSPYAEAIEPCLECAPGGANRRQKTRYVLVVGRLPDTPLKKFLLSR
ncbi:serine/threonine protein kinase [bacterium]|nr:serine/threonine protein kinase [bacterium]